MIKAYSVLSLIACAILSLTVAANAQGIATTGIKTLYAGDPLGQSLCLADGGYGSVLQAYEVRNRCSDINFNSYNADALTVGIEGSRDGVILSVGTQDELQKRYGFDETVGFGQGFASIQVSGGKAWILKDRRSRAMQELDGTDALFMRPTKENRSAPVRAGEIYLLRITDLADRSYQKVAKLIVLSHVPGESVTFRWLVL